MFALSSSGKKKSDGFDSLHLFLTLPLTKARSGGLQPYCCRGTWTYFCMPQAQKAGNHKSCSCRCVAGTSEDPSSAKWQPAKPAPLHPFPARRQGELLSSTEMSQVAISKRYINHLQHLPPKGWQRRMRTEPGIALGAQGGDGAEQGDTTSTTVTAQTQQHILDRRNRQQSPFHQDHSLLSRCFALLLFLTSITLSSLFSH